MWKNNLLDSPIKNLEILWIIIPIWINLIFTDLFQEKKGTNMGNAITNGAVMLWVGIDWIRYITRNFSGIHYEFIVNLLLCMVIIVFGIFVVYKGIKGKTYIKYIARVRETSYPLLMFSPVIYGIIEPNLKFILSIIIYFPIFYYLFEFLDKKIPDLVDEIN